MAIYHLSAKIISRSQGQSAVASAAYRSAERLHDNRIDESFDYSRKEGVEHTEILAPEGAPDWVKNREALWNAIEAAETRKDAQLAREIEIALPVELTTEQQIELARDFAQRTFVSQGMIVDLSVHLDNRDNPHAHLMLTTREVSEERFGVKRRDWNGKDRLLSWREQWAEVTNEHLQRAGHDIRIDHRTLDDQEVGLVAGRKIGISLERQQSDTLPESIAERVRQQREIAAENGRRIIADPQIALDSLTHQRATFTERDVACFLHTRTDGSDQFQEANLKVVGSPEVVTLGRDENGRTRYSTREMLGVERDLIERADRMAARAGHNVDESHRRQILVDSRLSEDQRDVVEHVTRSGDLSVVVGVAGSGKSFTLEAARHGWEAEGLTVHGAALSGIAAENLEHSSGMMSRTLASWERSWSKGYDQLTDKDVFVIDEAGLVGSRQLSRVLEHAENAGAKVVLVGDPEQLQAIEAGAPFRRIAEEVGFVDLNEVRRQTIDWQKQATQDLASGHTLEALAAYEGAGDIRAEATRAEARSTLLRRWDLDGVDHPGESRLILAATRADVHSLNSDIRTLRANRDELGVSETIETTRGAREFAPGDRLYFLKNDRNLGVKNGSLGTVEKIRDGVLQVQIDGPELRRVVVDTRQYADLDHGYAATIHKAQGTTVDRTYVLATPHMDRHSTYVALSRHREAMTLAYGEEDFRSEYRPGASPQENFRATLSRARQKEMAHDYLEPVGTPERERGAASPKRSRFAGLKLNVAPIAVEQEIRASGKSPVSSKAKELNRALDRVGRAYADAMRMHDQGLPVLPHQRQALDRASEELDKVAPGARRLANSALSHQPGMREAMTEKQGSERGKEMLKHMEQEQRALNDPNIRARRIAMLFKQLESKVQELKGWENEEARMPFEKRLQEVTLELKRDPQLESLVRIRKKELGIDIGSQLDHVVKSRSISEALDFHRTRSRGLSI